MASYLSVRRDVGNFHPEKTGHSEVFTISIDSVAVIAITFFYAT